MRPLICSIILTFHFSTIFAQMNGIYTIGGINPNYPDFQSAVNALTTSGVSGNVIFNIRAGIYDEKVTIPLINGTSPLCQVTFQSETADSSDVWWTSTSSNDLTNYIVTCQTAKFINFKNISFQNTGYGSSVFIFSGGASNCTVESCHFKTVGNVNSTNFLRNIHITSPNTSVDSNLYILNNNFENAGYGVKFSGISTAFRDSNLVITGNVTSGYEGIGFSNVEDIIVNNNTITSSYLGISLSGYGNPTTIIGNKVSANDQALLVQLNSGNAVTLAPFLVANNFLIGKKSTISVLSGGSNTHVLNNSIRNKYSSSTHYPALTISTSGSFCNNIVVNEDTGPAMKITSTNLTLESDYNLLYTAGSYLVTRTTANYTTLIDWQNSILTQDQHSWQHPPNFISPNDLHILSNIFLHNNAESVYQVDSDIDGELRDSLPDIGADEFVQPAVDAELFPEYQGVQQFDCSGSKILQVNIRNNGTDTLTSATISWSVNDIIQTSVNWTGDLPYLGISSAIELPFTIYQDSFAVLKIWVTDPNGQPDINPFNDTLQIDTVHTHMTGLYTVGNSTSYFNTIQEAVDALIMRGTCHNVTLSLANGIYAEEVVFSSSSISRETPLDTLFITSASLNQDSVIWKQSPSNPYSWLVQFSEISNVVVAHITFMRSAGDYSCINISSSGSENIEILDCLFRNATTSSIGKGILAYDVNNFRVKNCTFRFLEIGIDLTGGIIENVLIDRNQFYNIREYGIYTLQASNLAVQDNYFTNNWPFNIWGSTFSAMYLVYMHGYLDVDRNKIKGEFNSTVFVSYQGPVVDHARIQNNFFSVRYISENTGLPLMRCEVLDSGLIEIIHNSFNVKQGYNNSGVNATMTGFIGSQLNSTGLIIKNNSFFADESIDILNGISLSNPNVGNNNAFIGNLSVVSPNGGTGFFPSYISFDDLHLSGQELAGQGADLGLQYDIDSLPRPDSPTIGAVEKLPNNYDLSIAGFYTEPKCDSVVVRIDVFNNGQFTVDTAWVHFTINDTISDSLLLTGLNPNSMYDSILVAALPIVRDQPYIGEAHIIISDSVDQLWSNNYADFYVLYPPTPTIDLGDDTTICFEDFLLLSIPSSTLYSIVYLNDSLMNFPSDTALIGVNTIYVADRVGCQYFDTVNVSMESDPNLAITAVGDSLFSGGLIVDWYTLGSSGYSVIYQHNISKVRAIFVTDYYYIWTSPNGCQYRSSTYHYSPFTAGIDEDNLGSAIPFPNPFVNVLFLPNSEEIIAVKIYDAQMKQVNFVNNLEGEMQLSYLSSGVYFVQVTYNSGEIRSWKVVKI